MIREIITSTGPSYTLQLPEELIGKTVEIIAFEIDSSIQGEHYTSEDELEKRIKVIQNITKNSQVDLANYKFDRNEANNYDR